MVHGNGEFAVSGGVSLSYQLGGVAGVEVVTPQKGGVDWGTDEGLPAGWLAGAPVDMSSLVTETGQLAYAAGGLANGDRKSTRLNSSHSAKSRMPSSA